MTHINYEQGILLPGLDGSNPLGFLAALGVLRILGKDSLIRMKWTPSGGTWVPEVQQLNGDMRDERLLLQMVSQGLVNNIEDHHAKLLYELGQSKEELTQLRPVLDEIVPPSCSNREQVDWLAAFASDFATADATSQLQTARRDYYYGNLQSVIKETNDCHLQRSLFGPWDYADPLNNQSLHLDPSEDRRHAHQWSKPAGDPGRKKQGGMLGANRLAIEATPLFTSITNGDKLHTVGFTGNRSTNTYWTWPLWGNYITLPVVQSLLCLNELQAGETRSIHKDHLRERGIVAVFRTQRILVGKTPNFTPARCIVSSK